ncbi:polysaccharide deacetylase family protein [Shimazuella sp. AN120528]|uniref:polysaccharide deacetylase family protein n=1 Tax=Shimazuella soli TaxID=1892854 RepID=UPI001F0D101E|nr:polysaccharide deacetylase family protein [Shimazuella soli]MCH5584086.1 polysaccharide deacetylase family protein [Shimazuella soli]
MVRSLLAVSSLFLLLLSSGCMNLEAASPTKTEKTIMLSNNHMQKADAFHEQPLSLAEIQYGKNSVYFNGSRSKKWVALTFDDGPDDIYTPAILRILNKYHVHATFFLIGQKAAQYPNIVKQIVADGNIIADHSWDHPLLPKLSNQKVLSEIDRCRQQLKQITGKDVAIMRPPYGAIKGKKQVILRDGFQIVDWDVDTLDWKPGRTPEQILNSIKKELKHGSIILDHSGGGNRSATVKMLPALIQYLNSKGYQMVTVDQMLHIPAYKLNETN